MGIDRMGIDEIMKSGRYIPEWSPMFGEESEMDS